MEPSRKGKPRRGRLRLLRFTPALVAAAAAGLVIGVALPTASSPRFQVLDQNVHLPDPIEQLQQAEAATRYQVRVPSEVPSGTKLQHVDWMVDDDQVIVDIWFALPNGGRLHIWQTDHPLGHTFVTVEGQEGVTMTIAGREWTAYRVHWGEVELLQLSTRFDDGVTLSLDAPVSELDAQSLAEVAAALG